MAASQCDATEIINIQLNKQLATQTTTGPNVTVIIDVSLLLSA